MKYIHLLLTFLSIFLSLGITSPSKIPKYSPKTNACIQEYRFFFKNKHTDLFWIGENRYGECGDSHLIQVAIDQNNETTHLGMTELKEFNDWDWVKQAKISIKNEDYIEQRAENGKVAFPNMELSIFPPPINDYLQTRKENSYPNDCAKIWNRKEKNQGIDLPIMHGLQAKLLYYYSDGLYFNYAIDKVYIFPTSHYLVVFTKNQNLCDGENTMHGFMIFRFEIPK